MTSRLGLGCVTFGREIDQKASFGLMSYAFKKGMAFFDTAATYGAGASERIVGAWLKSNNEAAKKITVATKILPPYTRQNIGVSVAQSLERLQVGTIDLLYLHHWDASVENAEVLVTLNELVSKGLVKRLGASNFTASQLECIVNRQIEGGLSHFQFVQNNHSYAVGEVTDELYQVCQRFGIATVGYSPLAAGFLTGKYASGLPEDSRFARIPGHQQIYFNDAAQSRLEKIQKIAEKTGYSTIQLALAWALNQRRLASVLIGARKKEHIDQALTALAFDAPDVQRMLEE